MYTQQLLSNNQAEIAILGTLGWQEFNSCLWKLKYAGDSKMVHCMKSVRIQSYSGPYFPAFGLNTVHIQSECGKILTRITPNTDTFYAVVESQNFGYNRTKVASTWSALTFKIYFSNSNSIDFAYSNTVSIIPISYTF